MVITAQFIIFFLKDFDMLCTPLFLSIIREDIKNTFRFGGEESLNLSAEDSETMNPLKILRKSMYPT